MNTQFIFEQVADDKLLSQMSAKSKQDFPFDIRQIDWKHSLQCFGYGIRRFFLKEDTYEPGLHYR